MTDGVIDGIVLLGAPGSGKSTIGKKLSEITGYQYISSGDIARQIAEYDQSTRDRLDNGRMADEDMMVEEILNVIKLYKRYNDVFILDGFPRHMDQYRAISNIGMRLRYYYVKADADLRTRRMKNRGRDRADIIDDAIDSRITWYYRHTLPMVHHIVCSDEDISAIDNSYESKRIDTVAIICDHIINDIRGS